MMLPGLDRLGRVGLVGERKAVALLCLGFYSTLFFLIGLSARTEIPEWVPVFLGMLVIYGVAFFAVAAEWFWGRWFAVGLGYWGCSMTVMAWVAARELPPPMVIFGAMHALIALCLMGERMAATFDAKPGWRERWKLDEQGVIRVKKAVTRAASSLPALVMFALAPRQEQGWAALALAAVAVVGVSGLVAQRAWSIFVLGATGVAALGLAVGATPAFVSVPAAGLLNGPFVAGLIPVVLAPKAVLAFAGLLMLAAAGVFLTPMVAFLRRR